MHLLPFKKQTNRNSVVVIVEVLLKSVFSQPLFELLDIFGGRE